MHVLAILAADDDNGSGAAGLVQLGILLLIPLAMYFLMIRPQRRRDARAAGACSRSLEVGDEVHDDLGHLRLHHRLRGRHVVWLEIDDDVQIRVNRGCHPGQGPDTRRRRASGRPDAPTSGGTPSAAKVTPTVKGRQGRRHAATGDARPTTGGRRRDADDE